ncbi:MAG: hypothetical protein JXA52_09215, partial [Planctomycetes bacterium]|nr:hypothetical protein [Planctomycetota bacterium]
HPFFHKITEPFVRIVGGRKFSFIHGHELDPMNTRLGPKVGRILGLSSSVIEYAKGYPFFSSNEIGDAILKVEEELFLFWINLVRHLRGLSDYSNCLGRDFILPRHKRIEKLLSKYEEKKRTDGYDINIAAHTHRPGRFQNWHYNSGSWTDRTNNFLRILPDGKIGLFDWENDRPIQNNVTIEKYRSMPTFTLSPQAFN